MWRGEHHRLSIPQNFYFMSRSVFLAFFLVSVCVVIPFLWYYRNRNPNPRFRPRFGEMVLVAILAFGSMGGASMMMANLIGLDLDLNKLKTGIKEGIATGGQSSDDGDEEDADDKSNVFSSGGEGSSVEELFKE